MHSEGSWRLRGRGDRRGEQEQEGNTAFERLYLLCPMKGKWLAGKEGGVESGLGRGQWKGKGGRRRESIRYSRRREY